MRHQTKHLYDSSNEEIMQSYNQQNETRILALLMHKNQGIIHTIAVTGMPQIPLEDKLQACHIGLLRAIRSYDPTRGAKLITYAHWLMRQEIKKLNMQAFSWAYQEGVDAPIEATITTTIEEEMNDFVEIADESQEYKQWQEEIQTIIEDNLHGLKSRDVEIYCHYHALFGREEMNSYDLAERFNVSRQYINQTVNSVGSILESRLKKKYDREDLGV